jgi:hypothetical protein
MRTSDERLVCLQPDAPVRCVDEIATNGRKVFHERKAAMIARAAEAEKIPLRESLGHDRIGSANFDDITPVELARAKIYADRN